MQVIQEYIYKISSVRDPEITQTIVLIWRALHLKSRRTFLSCYHFCVTRLLEQTLHTLEQLSSEEPDVLLTHALKLRASRNAPHQIEEEILGLEQILRDLGIDAELDSNLELALAYSNIKTRRDALLKRLAHQEKIDPLTEAVNRVADQVDTRLGPRLKRLQDATLERH